MAWRPQPWGVGKSLSDSIATSRDGVYAGMTIHSSSALDSISSVILTTVMMTSRAMASAIMNKSQKLVPYDTGALHDSAYVSKSMGLLPATRMANSGNIAFIGPGGWDREYLPSNVQAIDVIKLAQKSGFSFDEMSGLSHYTAGYTAEHALIQHEGIIRGSAEINYTKGKSTEVGHTPQSHFLENAFIAMRGRQRVLVEGTMRTALAILKAKVEPKVKAVPVDSGLGTIGGARLNTTKVTVKL